MLNARFHGKIFSNFIAYINVESREISSIGRAVDSHVWDNEIDARILYFIQNSECATICYLVLQWLQIIFDVDGVMVSMIAFQEVDLGSIPGQRMYFIFTVPFELIPGYNCSFIS